MKLAAAVAILNVATLRVCASRRSRTLTRSAPQASKGGTRATKANVCTEYQEPLELKQLCNALSAYISGLGGHLGLVTRIEDLFSVATNEDAGGVMDMLTQIPGSLEALMDIVDPETMRDFLDKAGAKIVFATSMIYDGCMNEYADRHSHWLCTCPAGASGISIADSRCQDLAESAGHEGVFKAWLSDENSWPALTFIPAQGMYVLPNGAFVGTWENVLSGSLLHAIDHDEEGNWFKYYAAAWTGTASDGTPEGKGHDCSNWGKAWASCTPGRARPLWDGHIGVTSAQDNLWTDYVAWRSCGVRFRLYCFEQ